MGADLEVDYTEEQGKLLYLISLYTGEAPQEVSSPNRLQQLEGKDRAEAPAGDEPNELWVDVKATDKTFDGLGGRSALENAFFVRSHHFTKKV